LCGVAAVGGFLYFKDPFGWFGKAITRLTATPVHMVTDMPLPSLTATSLPVVTPSTTLPPTGLSSPTVEVIPTDTQTPQATLLDERVDLIPSIFVVLEGDFSSGINTNWDVWGEPRPKISSGPGDSWLDLAVADTPGVAGVTSKQEFILDAGVEIVIEGELNKTFPRRLIVDWDTVKAPRGPEIVAHGYHPPGNFKGSMLCQRLTRNSCEEISGAEAHIYRLRLLGDQGLELYLDQDIVPPGS
jgi:hypothetical protein